MEWSNEHWQGEMSILRSKIDRLDNRILHFIGKRMEICRNVGKFKLMVARF